MDNCLLIQKGDSSRAPLFLIHDAGGGIYNYQKLHDIGRPVYAISNPWQRNAKKWDGGTKAMVDECVELIKGVRGRGDILVGGFSYGGILALDVARTLACVPRSRLEVIGLVMVDTPFPYFGPPESRYAALSVDMVLAGCPKEMREYVLRCTLWSTQDSAEWAARNSKQTDITQGQIEAEEPPPAVLIWGKEHVRVVEIGSSGGDVAMCDVLRRCKGGWDERFPHPFISAVWEIGAHHFAFFDAAKLAETSNKVREACDLLAED